MVKFMDGTAPPYVGIQVDGKVSRSDVASLAALLEEAIRNHGRIRVLIHLVTLGGIEPRAFWEDLKFTVRHLRDFERVALVGDAAWQAPYARLASPLFPGEVRHFESEKIDDAWAWLRKD